MKKKKLNLKTLKVNSFVTSISSESIYTLKGGGSGSSSRVGCDTDDGHCISDISCPTFDVACLTFGCGIEGGNSDGCGPVEGGN